MTKKIYICGCVKNCQSYLLKVFDNIKRIGQLFDEYKIIISYDESQDDTYKILLDMKRISPNVEILVNKKPLASMRTANIGRARNSILDYIKKDNDATYEYFIMMDFDDVNAGQMNIDVLRKYVTNPSQYDWDSLSFNRQNYYDIWALSIDKYIFSCWHWENNHKVQFSNRNVVDIMTEYIKNKLDNLNSEQLLECYSAFNGFAIYKKNKFLNCRYEFNVNSNIQIIPTNLLVENMKALNMNYHVHFIEDCEHRFFHMQSIFNNKSKVRISPLILFQECNDVSHGALHSALHSAIHGTASNMLNNVAPDNSSLLPPEFTNLYNQIKKNPKLKQQILGQFIHTGMTMQTQTNNIYLKEALLLKLIEIVPEEPGFYYYMGYAFKDINPQKALPFYKKSYAINPHNVENMIDLCNLLYEDGKSMEVIEMNKKIPFDNNLLGDIRFLTVYSQCKCKTNYHKDCLNDLLFIIQQKKNLPITNQKDKDWIFSNYVNIGHLYSILGDYNKSIEYSEKAVSFANQYNLTTKEKLTSLQNLLCFYDYSYSDKTNNKTYLKINDIIPNVLNYSFSHRTKKERKIRIGYVSSDLLNHAVANFIYPVLKNHDKERFEIYLFPNLELVFPLFAELNLPTYNIFKLTNGQAAKLINENEIDILIDLNGHTAESRLGIFALNPAPIQMTYIGYPNTTGLKSIQYRITDAVADCDDTTQFYSEELLRMPKCFLLFHSINQSKPVEPRKTKDVVILGALNKENKNSSYVLDTWKNILKECPNTRLLIKLESYDNQVERSEFYMKQLGVEKNRLLLMTKMENDGYNKLFSMVDILLDTFPYSGTTTTCNALFNSIPVVSLYKKNIHAHNVSSSLLIHSGLPELVAKSTEEYVQIVKDLVNNPQKINEYKVSIRDKFMKLMEPKEFMKSYEEILSKIYTKHFDKDMEKDTGKIEIQF